MSAKPQTVLHTSWECLWQEQVAKAKYQRTHTMQVRELPRRAATIGPHGKANLRAALKEDGPSAGLANASAREHQDQS